MALHPKQYPSIHSYPNEAISDDHNWQKVTPSPNTSTRQSNGAFHSPLSVNPQRIHYRPYVFKYLFSRPRLLPSSNHGEIKDSRAHGVQSASGVELGLLQSSDTAKIEPVGVMCVYQPMEAGKSNLLAKRGLL